MKQRSARRRSDFSNGRSFALVESRTPSVRTFARSRRCVAEYGWSVRRSDRLLVAAASAVVLVLVAGCGTQHATSSYPATGPSPSAKPSFPECPQVPGVVDPSPCASVGAEQNQQANQTFNSRIPLPGPVAAEAATGDRTDPGIVGEAHLRLNDCRYPPSSQPCSRAGCSAPICGFSRAQPPTASRSAGMNWLSYPHGRLRVGLCQRESHRPGIRRHHPRRGLPAQRRRPLTASARAGPPGGIRRIRIPWPAAGSPRTPPRCPSRR